MRQKVIESLNWRYAVKEFDTEKKISDEDMNAVLESLRLTASSFGLQYWEFVHVKNKDIRDQLLEKSWNQKQVVEASDLLVLCIKKEATLDHVDEHIHEMVKTHGKKTEDFVGFKKVVSGFIEKKSPEEVEVWMRNQVYIALGNLLTVAALLEIDSCPMEGFVKSAYDKILNLDELGLKSVVVCPLGYRKNTDKYATMRKVRFPLNKVVKTID